MKEAVEVEEVVVEGTRVGFYTLPHRGVISLLLSTASTHCPRSFLGDDKSGGV